MSSTGTISSLPAGAFVHGEALDGTGRAEREVVDPATGKVIYTVADATVTDIDDAVRSAAGVFTGEWRSMAPAERGRRLLRLAELIREQGESLALAETLDTGKPLSQARDDVATAARYFEFYAGVADKIGGTTIPLPEGTFAYTVREPLGVVAHITPWNSPLSQMSRGVAPSLASGNTVVVKPSELTPSTTLRLARLIVEAGIPAGACNVVLGDGAVGASLAAHPGVRHVTFTGSVETGVKVATSAASRIIGATLELGGKSATIVFPDADLDLASTAGANAAVRNSGQSCFATTRQVVHRSVYAEYVALTAAKMSGLKVGSGVDDPDLGPLASSAQRARVQRLVENAVGAGVRVANSPDFRVVKGGGYFFPPVLLADVAADMEIAQSEVFGPVQTVIPFDTEEEAVTIANGTQYGLAAGLFTRDIGRVQRLAPLLEAGQVQVNKYPQGGVEIPFGGYKNSGLGREKGLAALDGYTQLKTVLIAY